MELGAGSVGLDGRTAESNRENCIRSNNAVLVAAALPSSAPPYPPYPPLAVLEPLPTHTPRELQTPTCIESVCDSVKVLWSAGAVRGSLGSRPIKQTAAQTFTPQPMVVCSSVAASVTAGITHTDTHACSCTAWRLPLATCYVVCLQCNCLQGCVVNTTTRRIRRGRAQNSLYGNPL